MDLKKKEVLREFYFIFGHVIMQEHGATGQEFKELLKSALELKLVELIPDTKTQRFSLLTKQIPSVVTAALKDVENEDIVPLFSTQSEHLKGILPSETLFA